jgi:hypothetical protein
VIGVGGTAQVLLGRYLVNLINKKELSVWDWIIIDQESLMDPIKKISNVLNKILKKNIEIPRIKHISLPVRELIDRLKNSPLLNYYFGPDCLENLKKQSEKGFFGYPCIGDFVINSVEEGEKIWEEIENLLMEWGGEKGWKEKDIVVIGSLVGGTGAGLMRWVIEKLEEKKARKVHGVFVKRWFAPNPEKYNIKDIVYDSNEKLTDKAFEFFKWSFTSKINTEGLGDKEKLRLRSDAGEIRIRDLYTDELIVDFDRLIFTIAEEIATGEAGQRVGSEGHREYKILDKYKGKEKNDNLKNNRRKWLRVLEYLSKFEPYRITHYPCLRSEFSKKVREFIEKIPKSSPEKKSVKAIENEIKESLEKLKELYTVDDKESLPSLEKDLVMKEISLDATEVKFENIEEIIYNIWYRMVREEK